MTLTPATGPAPRRTSPTGPVRVSPYEALADAVGEQISRWGVAVVQHGGGPHRSEAVALLSMLRRGSLDDLGRVPQVWAAVVTSVPESLRGSGDESSPAEASAFAAMAMFAVHQQSQPFIVHERGRPLGAALGQLAKSSAHSEAGMTRRFGALITSESQEEMLHHLRSLVTLLRTARRSDGSPLQARVDYGTLARDLALLMDPRYAPGVRLRWGRDYARVRPGQGATVGLADHTSDEASTGDANLSEHLSTDPKEGPTP